MPDWTRVAFVDGHGTTLVAQRYAIRLPGLEPGTYHFRLKQVDYDGAFAYSPEVEVAVGVSGGTTLLPAYPNPFQASSSIAFTLPTDGQAELVVYDALGHRVATLFQGPVERGRVYRRSFDAAGLPNGVYFSTLRFNGRQQTEKLILVR